MIFLENLIFVDFFIHFLLKKAEISSLGVTMSNSSRALVPVERKLPSLRRKKA